MADATMSMTFFWVVTLHKNDRTYEWSLEDGDMKHSLIVRQAVLGPEVPDGEVNVIEVEAKDYRSISNKDGKLLRIPMVVLKGGIGHSQCVLDLSFLQTPIKLKLVKGNGPIQLLGNYIVTQGSHDTSMSNEDSEEEKIFDE